MSEPKIIMPPSYAGHHNDNIETTTARLLKSRQYKDLSTVIICPTRGTIHCQVVQSWMGLIRPMNQPVYGPIFASGMEVGGAYESMIDSIVNNPAFDNFKYLVTVEEDNLPPPDGLLLLYEGIEEFDVVGGLYWTKGEAGQPMIYGDPSTFPRNYIPQPPKPNTLQAANGLGMGFNMYKLGIFRDKRLRRPWFKTLQQVDANGNASMMTQDLYFYDDLAKFGYKVACDTRIKVGHFDAANSLIW